MALSSQNGLTPPTGSVFSLLSEKTLEPSSKSKDEISFLNQAASSPIANVSQSILSFDPSSNPSLTSPSFSERRVVAKESSPGWIEKFRRYLFGGSVRETPPAMKEYEGFKKRITSSANELSPLAISNNRIALANTKLKAKKKELNKMRSELVNQCQFLELNKKSLETRSKEHLFDQEEFKNQMSIIDDNLKSINLELREIDMNLITIENFPKRKILMQDYLDFSIHDKNQLKVMAEHANIRIFDNEKNQISKKIKEVRDVLGEARKELQKAKSNLDNFKNLKSKKKDKKLYKKELSKLESEVIKKSENVKILEKNSTKEIENLEKQRSKFYSKKSHDKIVKLDGELERIKLEIRNQHNSIHTDSSEKIMKTNEKIKILTNKKEEIENELTEILEGDFVVGAQQLFENNKVLKKDLENNKVLKKQLEYKDEQFKKLKLPIVGIEKMELNEDFEKINNKIKDVEKEIENLTAPYKKYKKDVIEEDEQIMDRQLLELSWVEEGEKEWKSLSKDIALIHAYLDDPQTKTIVKKDLKPIGQKLMERLNNYEKDLKVNCDEIPAARLESIQAARIGLQNLYHS